MATAIAGAVATGLGGGVIATTIGYVVAIVVVLAAAAILGKLLAPNLPKSSRNTKGIQNVIRSNIMPRRIVYGEAVTGGPYLVLETEGDQNELLTMTVALTTHPVEDVLGVMIEDQYIDISGNTNGTTNLDANDLGTDYWVDTGRYGTGEAANHVRIIKNLGWGYADHQYVTDGTVTKCVNDRERAALVDTALTTAWTQPSTTRDSQTGIYTDSGYKVTNCAYIFLQFKFNRDIWSGFPKVRFHVKGKPLYNPYLDANLVSDGADSAGTHDLNDPDTWEWSEDWTLCVLDYLINKFYGLGAKVDPADILTEINWSEAIQSYQDSSVLITNGLPSPDTNTTPRFTINGVLETGSTPISNMEALLTSGGGALIYAQGEYKLRPAIYRQPESEANIINEDMIVSPLSIRTHTPRSEVFNKAAGMFTDKGYDPDQAFSTQNKPTFEPTDFGIVDPLDSSGTNPYEVMDGEEIIRDYDFPLTTREFEAQRLARIQLERARRGLTVSFEANMQVLKYSVGDTVYLEILSDSKYANEDFYNRLGLDDAVQTQDSPLTSPYYKQFRILEMQYSSNSTINMVMQEEAPEIYEWNEGYANPSDSALESEIIADDPNGEVLPPSFVVNSPYQTIEEVIATESGTTVTTLVRWSAAERGSLVNALDQVHINYYKLEYGEVTDPSLTEANRVAQWIPAGNKSSDHSQVTQGPLALETLYKDGVSYDFRVAGVTYSGRQSAWTYYSTDIGSDYSPTAAPATSALTINYTNDSHSVPVTNLGVETWTGSGGLLQVFEGTNALTLDQNAQSTGYPTTSGEYRLDITAVSGDTLTEPAITGQTTTTATLADWAGDLTTVTVYRVTAYILTPGSVQTTLSVDLSLTPGDQGSDGAAGAAGADGEVGWGHDLVFSATDSDTVEWTGGSIWTAGGATFPIDSAGGNTGNMTQRTYIYFDGNSPVPDTLSTTTDAQTAVGADKILIAVAEDTTDNEAFFQVFGGYGGLLITGNEVVANSITANNINASFYTGRNFTGGTFQTRSSSNTSPYAGTPRAVIQEVDPQLAIYSNDGSNPDSLIFGVTDIGGGEAEVSIIGDFLAGSLDTAQMYSSAGITDLRGRLGVTVQGTPTGGITTLTSIPQTLVPAETDYELDVDIYETGLNANTFNFTIFDNESRNGGTNQPYTAPSWDIEFYYTDDINSPISWTLVPGADWTIVGTTDDFYEAESDTYYNSFYLNATRSVEWTPASPFTSGDTIYYMIQVTKNSGDHSNPRLNACNVSEAVVGGTIQNLADLGDVDLTGAVNNDLLYKSASDTWSDTNGKLTWDGTKLTIFNSGGTVSGSAEIDATFGLSFTPNPSGTFASFLDTDLFVIQTESTVSNPPVSTDSISNQVAAYDTNINPLWRIGYGGNASLFEVGCDVRSSILNVYTMNSTGSFVDFVYADPDASTGGVFGMVNYEFDCGQTVDSGTDNYVLTYNNSTGLISLEVVPGGGTVTSVAAGNGLDFTTITASGSVVLGVPTTLTDITTNAVTATSHTHAITTTGTGTIVSQTSPTFNGSSVHTAGRYTFNDNIELTFGTGDDVDMYFNGTDMFTDMPVGADWLLRGGTANDNMIVAYTDGAVELYFDGTSMLFTQQYNTDGNTSGAILRDHANNLRDAGFNDQVEISMTTSNITLNDEHAGALILRTGSSTVEVAVASSTTTFPIGSMCTVLNHGTGGALTISDGAEAMYFMDGSGTAVDSTGLTLAIAGVCNIWRQGDSAYYVWGSGLS